ncbi:four helix bundle protein [Arcicella sp. DC2W]|uniref:Four helix bundle protein n=1 Tax=Arcicella gelida TaxID=2984195 RepID=A0ABU5RYT4_9BACT|nr:four helix bundle protein [Arcicella sp. DC2W]MEA5401384.1 four helix bundle protein [Arcicella sp. DC2W]
MRDFRKYDVWQLAHNLVLEIYDLTKDFPKSELYGLTNQLRRASISIPTNISEGCGRSSDADFNRFLQIALGSAHEVEYLIQLSTDLNFVTVEKHSELAVKVNLIKKKLYHLSQKLIGN